MSEIHDNIQCHYIFFIGKVASNRSTDECGTTVCWAGLFIALASLASIWEKHQTPVIGHIKISRILRKKSCQTFGQIIDGYEYGYISIPRLPLPYYEQSQQSMWILSLSAPASWGH